jgi:signal peptidase I
MIDAQERAETALHRKGALRDNLEVVCFAVLLIMFFKTFVGQQFVIPSASMRNTLMIGDHLLSNKFIFAVPQWEWEAKLFPMRSVRRGDIIVFRYPLARELDFVKRCVALPGDLVQVSQKRLFVNGRQATGTFEHHLGAEGPLAGPWPLSRDAGPLEPQPGSQAVWPYADPAVQAMDQQGQAPLAGGFRDELAPVRVPEGFLLAMGDNRDNSSDGRYWGFLPMDHLRSRPFLVWWNFREGGDDDTNASTAFDPTDILRNLLDGTRHFFS